MSHTRKQRGKGHGRPRGSRRNVVMNNGTHRRSHHPSRHPGHVSPRSMYALRASVRANQRSTLKAWKKTSPRTRQLKMRQQAEAAERVEKARRARASAMSMARQSAKASNAAKAAKEKHDNQMRIMQQRMERDTRADRLPEMRAKADSAMTLLRSKKGALGMRGMADELMAAVVDHNYDAVIAMLSGLSVHNGPSHAASASAASVHHEIRWNSNDD